MGVVASVASIARRDGDGQGREVPHPPSHSQAQRTAGHGARGANAKGQILQIYFYDERVTYVYYKYGG